MDKLEYFKSEFIITGKHARLVDDLWKLNQIQESYFKRLVDIYTIGPIIGLRTNRMASRDSSEDGKRTVQLQQIMTRLDELSTIMQMVLLLDESEHLTIEERVDRTFRGPRTKEDFDHNVEIFNSYVRGGIEVLHEQLVQRALGVEDDYTEVRVGNIIALLDNPLAPDLFK